MVTEPFIIRNKNLERNNKCIYIHSFIVKYMLLTKEEHIYIKKAFTMHTARSQRSSRR